MKNTNKDRAKSILLYLAVAVLFATTIFMFAEYCILKNSSSYSKLPELSTSDSVFLDYSDNGDIKNSSLITPSFIGIVSGKKFSPMFDITREEILQQIIPFVSELFLSESKILEFSSDDERTEYADREIYSKNSFVYLAFSEQIPGSAIYPALTGKTLDSIYHSFGVKELFIFCDNLGNLSGAALDCNGNIAELKARSRSSLSFDDLTAYDSTHGMVLFDFADIHGKKYPVFEKSVSVSSALTYTETRDFLTENSDDASVILEAFGFNPNGTRFYRTRNSSITYVENRGELRISSEGDISFTAFSEGVPLSEILSKQSEHYSFEDKIGAAKKILSSLDETVFGMSAKISLTDLVFDKRTGLLSMSFSYFFDGIMISEYENSIQLVFSDSALVSAQLDAVSFVRSEKNIRMIPQKLLFALESANLSANSLPHSFLPVYVKDKSSGEFLPDFAFSYHPTESIYDEGEE